MNLKNEILKVLKESFNVLFNKIRIFNTKTIKYITFFTNSKWNNYL